jgi:hypothetical protein
VVDWIADAADFTDCRCGWCGGGGRGEGCGEDYSRKKEEEGME